MVNHNLPGAVREWRKASFCGEGTCVEVALGGDSIGVRDSKHANSPQLAFTRAEWDAFVRGVKAGEFDLV